MASLTPDLDGSVCAVAGCLSVADAIAVAAVRVPPMVGLSAERSRFALEVPMCAEHQHLMRMGVDEFDLDTRL